MFSFFVLVVLCVCNFMVNVYHVLVWCICCFISQFAIFQSYNHMYSYVTSLLCAISPKKV